MSKTQLKKLKIEIFRALNNVEIEFGDHITVICGKNGTSKSSILGIAAQMFSFDKDYVKDTPLSYRQITGGDFKSRYRDHFRISDTFDIPGSMKVDIELQDGYTNQAATAKLELMKRNKSPRPVVRNNSAAVGNTSRNFTHPVIFLSLKRLYPIADREYNVIDFDYLNTHSKKFIGLTNELLNRSSSRATGTEGTISSAVAHGDNYDQESVSAGEDNAGQIVLAIMSFRKLKEDYPDYKGGLLLIDEADAGLFPTAQINLLKMLDRECKDLNLQVVMTSHSPTLIEYAFEQSQAYRKRYKTVYLSNTYGDVQIMQNMSWPQISADILTRSIAASPKSSLPKINIYFEDKEGFDLYKAIMNRQSLNKFTNPLADITLGCSNYIQLIQKKVTEFSDRSIVCLDADVAQSILGKNLKTVLLLPGHLPPDQLIFEYLYNLPADHAFWKNDLQFTRDVFTNSASELIRELAISGGSVDVKKCVAVYQKGSNDGKPKTRDMFKRFYKTDEFQRLVVSGVKSYNPWKSWIESHQEACNKFLNDFMTIIRNVMKNGHFVDESKLTLLNVKLKGP
ncbi:MAG: AAA family ATPase [Geobacteraceae bacterium]